MIGQEKIDPEAEVLGRIADAVDHEVKRYERALQFGHFQAKQVAQGIHDLGTLAENIYENARLKEERKKERAEEEERKRHLLDEFGGEA